MCVWGEAGQQCQDSIATTLRRVNCALCNDVDPPGGGVGAELTTHHGGDTEKGSLGRIWSGAGEEGWTVSRDGEQQLGGEHAPRGKVLSCQEKL